MEERTYTVKALTDIWTGDADGKPHRLITIGLLGSIRWWFEVLVRGLGGSACDPTRDGIRCPDHRVADPTKPGHHCVVCELFGCTGWARKFRFEVLDENGKPQQNQIKANQCFQLRFTPLRAISEKEWALLDLTLRLITEYGAIGGKTVYKPTEESHRQSVQRHQDFGLVKLVPHQRLYACTDHELRTFVSQQQWRSLNHGSFGWASAQNFWCVSGRHLSREDADHSSFNRVLGREESKSCLDCGQVHDPPQRCGKTNRLPRRRSEQNPTGNLEKWLAGGRAESKKVFSFKNPESARRTFGFVQSTDKLDEMRQRLKKNAWDNLGDNEFVTGGDILRRLLGEGGNR
ncbi:MAG: type III-B CRISPR module RAMP protein Cmr1 [bacterium]